MIPPWKNPKARFPARLEECDTLESLRKWHWVDLFDDDGYEMLMRALRARADKIGVYIKSDELIKSETLPFSPATTVVDGLNWKSVSHSEIFYARLCDAFPGVRENEKFNGEEAITRLNVLLRQPLSIDLSSSPLDGQVIPFWWLRGRADMYVNGFRHLGTNRVLMDNLELCIEYVVAVRKFSSTDRNFVYVQCLPEKPTGLYKYPENWLKEYMQDRFVKDHGCYFFEEYGLWGDRMVTRQEYDDGATVANGKPVSISGAELRLRYITPFNFILCGGDHILLQSGVDVDVELSKLLDEILLEKKTVNDLVAFVDNLPKVTKRK